ncbi:MAG: hypothetical protein D3910_14520 [Candidatus Electrothrix sp. ATG2]|nr:hypothetical protein [Candidatus Electrothrix sp. ATG2]
MLVYKILFSYKHKLQLQKKILGYTNANMYSGVDQGASSFKYNDYSLLKIYKRAKLKRTDSSVVHFEKLVSLLREKGIDFYYIPVPIQRKNKYADGEYNEMFLGFFPEMKKKYSNVFFSENYEKHPGELFRDFVHFNEEGLVSAHKFMRGEVDSIINRYR